ncbi:Uncharacterized protein PCOAH_00012020 [Plasmodium coatneyi]|uniref:histone acetyltransferase n=1 Tax=Plasmodium coatneyi TaxID=208452 RepID=A0A1B1DVJ2_9APIC|nr:Uncharacterized protein PCOAH_00012020 [Plasmodium coatneyi]ANQ06798.1 Uncharacterized protein PCOAH_00012020 [Plasmodium coatneyi]
MTPMCSNNPSIDTAEESKNEEMDREYYSCIKNCANDLQNLSLNFFPAINTYTCIPKINAINSITFHPCISSEDYFNNTYSFKPLFTHHFFSDSEQVIGFDSLKIDFYYTCDSYDVFMKLSGSICDQYENSNYIMLMLLQSLYITTPYPGGFIETEEEFLKILRRNEGAEQNEQQSIVNEKTKTSSANQGAELTQEKIYKPPGFIIYEKKLCDDIYLQIRKCGFSSEYFKMESINCVDGEEDELDDDYDDEEEDVGGVYQNGITDMVQNEGTNGVKNEITLPNGQPCSLPPNEKSEQKKGNLSKEIKSENETNTKGVEINNTSLHPNGNHNIKEEFPNEPCEDERKGEGNGADTAKYITNEDNCGSSTMSNELNKDVISKKSDSKTSFVDSCIGSNEESISNKEMIKKEKEENDLPPGAEIDGAGSDNDDSLIESKKAKNNLTKYVTERDMSKLYRHYLRIVRAKKRRSLIAKAATVKEKSSPKKKSQKKNSSAGSALEAGQTNGGNEPNQLGVTTQLSVTTESAAPLDPSCPKGTSQKGEISPNQSVAPKKGGSPNKPVEPSVQNPPNEKETNKRKKKNVREELPGEKYDYTVKNNFELLHRKVEWFYHWFIESASNIEYDYRWSVILPYIVFKHDEEKKFTENKFIENLNVQLLKNRSTNVSIRPSIKLDSMLPTTSMAMDNKEESLPTGMEVEDGNKKKLKRGATDATKERKDVKKRKKGQGGEAEEGGVENSEEQTDQCDQNHQRVGECKNEQWNDEQKGKEQDEVMVKKEVQDDKKKKKNTRSSSKEGEKIQENHNGDKTDPMFDPNEYVLTSEIVIKAIENTLNDVRSKDEEEYYSFHKNYDVIYLYSDLEKGGAEASNGGRDELTKGVVENVQPITDVKAEKKTKGKKGLVTRGRKGIQLKEEEIVKNVTNDQDRGKKNNKNKNKNTDKNKEKNTDKNKEKSTDTNEKQSLYYFYLFGLATTYTFFTFQFDRNRISQFLIFPPMQSKGLGMKVLEKIYHLSIVNSNVKEITVEDPAVSFTQLRDIITIKMCIDLRILNPTILYPSDYLKTKNIDKEDVELDKKKFMKVCKETHKQITRMIETLLLAGVLPHPAPCYADIGEDKVSGFRKKEKKNESPVCLNSMEHFESSDLCKDVRIKIKKRIKNDYIGNLINKNMNCMASDVFQDYVMGRVVGGAE